MNNERQTDAKGNRYEDIGNIRLTYILSENREESKNWSGKDVIRLQSYKNENNKSLHQGAEIPIDNPSVIIDIIESLIKIYKDKSL